MKFKWDVNSLSFKFFELILRFFVYVVFYRILVDSIAEAYPNAFSDGFVSIEASIMSVIGVFFGFVLRDVIAVSRNFIEFLFARKVANNS